MERERDREDEGGKAAKFDSQRKVLQCNMLACTTDLRDTCQFSPILSTALRRPGWICKPQFIVTEVLVPQS